MQNELFAKRRRLRHTVFSQKTGLYARGGKGSGDGGYRRHTVLEIKAVSNLKMVGGDKTGFRAWHERLVNIMEQIRPGSRSVLRALVRHVDHEVTEDFHERF